MIALLLVGLVAFAAGYIIGGMMEAERQCCARWQAGDDRYGREA